VELAIVILQVQTAAQAAENFQVEPLALEQSVKEMTAVLLLSHIPEPAAAELGRSAVLQLHRRQEMAE
jgi:hypothetical protein